MRFLDAARLLLALVLFTTASFTVVTAPTHLIWMVAIGVTELGHMLAVICLGAAPLVWSNSWSGRLAAGLCVAAALVALTPVLRASRLARSLPAQLRAQFGEAPHMTRGALVYRDLYRGVSPPEVKAETLIYNKTDNEDLALDFYRAQFGTRAPLVIAIHGGSWQSGDNKQFVSLDRYLAGRGFAVADILYRLAPAAKFPAALDDVRSAIAYLRNRADTLGIDPNRIVLLGRSAGGQIALAVAYGDKDPGIRGVISFYAPADLYYSWENPGNPLVIDTRQVLRDYLGGGPAEVKSNYEMASPDRLVTPGSPPTLLLYGGRDELVSSHQGALLSKRLLEAGVPYLNVSLPWATHGFDYFFRGPGGQISIYAVEYFLLRVTQPARGES